MGCSVMNKQLLSVSKYSNSTYQMCNLYRKMAEDMGKESEKSTSFYIIAKEITKTAFYGNGAQELEHSHFDWEEAQINERKLSEQAYAGQSLVQVPTICSMLHRGPKVFVIKPPCMFYIQLQYEMFSKDLIKPKMVFISGGKEDFRLLKGINSFFFFKKIFM